MIYRVLFSLLVAKAAGFASNPGKMMGDHDEHHGHTHDELHTHVQLNECSTVESFMGVYGCVFELQMAGCWECPHNNPNGQPAATTDCDSELCHRQCPQCTTWGNVPCHPGSPNEQLTQYTPMQPYSATDPMQVDFCMTEEALSCRRGCAGPCRTCSDGETVPGSVRSARPPSAAARISARSDYPPLRATAVPGGMQRLDAVPHAGWVLPAELRLRL